MRVRHPTEGIVEITPPPPPPVDMPGEPSPPPEPAPPPPKPPPAPPPEPPMQPAPVVEIPEEAKVITRTAKGDPEFLEHKGERYYAPASTMAKMGFTTHTEYLMAQRAGVAYGIHEGELVPKDSVIVAIRQAGKTVKVRYSGETGGELSVSVLSSVRKDKYQVPITTIDAKGKETTKWMPAKTAKAVGELEGKAQFDRMVDLGVYPKGSQFVPGEKAEYTWIHPLELQKEEKDRRVWEANKIELADGQWVLKTNWRLLDKKYQNIGLAKGYSAMMAKINADHITLPDGSLIMIDDWNIIPPEYQGVAMKEGFDTMMEQFKTDHKELPDGNFVLIKDWVEIPVSYQVIAMKKGFDAMVNQMEADNRANEAAVVKLKPYTDEEGGVDGAKFLQDNPTDRKTLADAGFIGQEIADWRVYNAGLPPALFWSGEMEIQSQGYKDRVLDLMITRPHLAQNEAESIARAEFIAKGLPLKDSPDFPERIKLAKAHFDALSPAEKAMVKKQWKNLPVEMAELVVPGVYVARNWTTLSTKDKVINIAIDVAAVLLAVGVFKLAGASIRMLSGTTKVRNLATKAGRAGLKLQEATNSFAKAQKVLKLKVGSKMWIKHANAVAKAQATSMRADRAFLQGLERLKQISAGELTRIETQSGLKGIAGAIKAVTKAQTKIEKLWKKVNKLKFVSDPKTKAQIAANNRHLRALAELQKAQAELQSALGRAGSALQPRYRPSPPPDKFEGFGMQWEKGKPPPKIDAANKTTLDALESWLAMEKGVTLTGKEPWVMPKTRVATAVLEKPKVAPPTPEWRLKLKAQYAKAKPKPKPKPAVPKVKPSKFPGIKPKVKDAARIAAAAIPAEAFGRMTAAQIAKYYATEEALEAVSSTLIKNLTKMKAFEQVSAETMGAIKLAMKPAIDAYVKSMLRQRTAVQIRTAVAEALKARIQPKALTKTQLRVATATVIKAIVTAPPAVPIRPPPKVPLKVPPPTPVVVTLPGVSDKKKRKLIKDSKGSIGWRQGELHGKSVWMVGLFPYNQDENWLSVLGKKPSNMTEIKGPGSARQTIKLRYGKPPVGRVTGDFGFMDFAIDPKEGNRVTIDFKADPKRLTTGDVTLGISRKRPPITEKLSRLPGGVPPRITPKRPGLGG